MGYAVWRSMSFEQQIELSLIGPFGIGFAALWGALWGSFFNVVICRVPAGESLVKPPSHCRVCGEAVRWYDNIPILSYLLLRGRCRHCGAGYSIRYMLVELLVAALAVVMHQVFVVHGAGEIGLRAGQLVITSLFSGLLVAISLIDYDTRLIPNVITYPAIPICALLSVFMQLPHLWDGPVGAVGGYALIWLIAEGYYRLRKREGMGLGDAKLMAMIGGLLGWQGRSRGRRSRGRRSRGRRSRGRRSRGRSQRAARPGPDPLRALHLSRRARGLGAARRAANLAAVFLPAALTARTEER